MSRLIRDLVDVRPRPTVVRLEHLEARDADWISASYHVTEAVEAHLQSLRTLLGKSNGCGIFLIGHFGSGKSHFLAWITQQLRLGTLLGPEVEAPQVTTLSLLNYRAEITLEQAVAEALGLDTRDTDRRRIWDRLGGSRSTLLVIDELSEFLRSKPDRQAFTEDVRFLQFMGEWAQSHRLWVMAAVQEQIEHTGELESSLYRKIKDRYPIRYLLTPQHVRGLIAESILIKRPGYSAATEQLSQEIRQALPGADLDLGALTQLYPIHPATIELLEEVRDLFSQNRGIVDFVTTRLAGREGRAVEPFLDRPWGDLLTPETIIDHFSDLFEVQPEFLALAQRLLPYYRKRVPEIFETRAQQELGWRLIKLLMLDHISPQREGLRVEDAAAWLLVRATSIAPAKNLQIVERLLGELVSRGRYVREAGDSRQQRRGRRRYLLDLKDDSAEQLDRLLEREVAEIRAASVDAIWECLVGALAHEGFNPFSLPRDTWARRTLSWHFHEREYGVFFGNADPTHRDGVAMCVRLPWGNAGPVGGLVTLVPTQLEPGSQLLELAALLRLKGRPGTAERTRLIESRLEKRKGLLVSRIRTAFLEAKIFKADGHSDAGPRAEVGATVRQWLDAHAIWAFRKMLPRFEAYAPKHGPLPKEAYRQLMRVAREHDLGDFEDDDHVRLIREAYLVPMGLMKRESWYYRTVPKLGSHELVRLVMPVIESRPEPKAVYEHLAGPVFGLVPDQIHLLLIFMLLQGELDLVKCPSKRVSTNAVGRSYRDLFESMPLPIQYDRIEPGRGLSIDLLRALEELCKVLGVRTPRQWTVMAQRQAIVRLSEAGRKLRRQVEPALLQVKQVDPDSEIGARLERVVKVWTALAEQRDELAAFEQLIYEASSSSRLVAWVREAQGISDQLARMLGELKRFAHLLDDPVLRSWADAGIQTRVDALGRRPGLDDVAVIEQWLNQAAEAYELYCIDYQRRHDEWWAEQGSSELWSWQPPAASRSRHVGLREDLSRLEQAQDEAKRLRCRSLTDLEYRPQCTCGFDGQRAAASAPLEILAGAKAAIETETARFFRQSSVREKIRSLGDSGLELSVRTREYLEGHKDLPELDDIDLLDRHLAGLQLVQEVETEPILRLLEERVWQAPQLLESLAELLRPYGEARVRFEAPRARGTPAELVIWCVEQALRQAEPLPSGLGRDALDGAASLIRPEWISQRTWSCIEDLGLGRAIEDRALGLVVDQAVVVEDRKAASLLVGAALEVVQPTEPGDPAGLARLSARLYRAHQRLFPSIGEPWLSRLGRLAETSLDSQPPVISVALEARLEAQWLVVDCLGPPLVETLDAALAEALHSWRVERRGWALASPSTTTDAWFRGLAERGLNHALEKINGVDRLLHDRRLSFGDLERLALAELQVGLRGARRRLEPDQPLVVLADHGFRLDRHGVRFVHGGPSTLERVVPFFDLSPLEV